MKRLLIICLLIVPIVASAQESQLTKRQSKKRIARLAELQRQYREIRYLPEGDIVIVSDSNYRDGVVDLSGREILPCQYHIHSFYDSPLLLVENDSLQGFLNRNGEWVLPMVYDASDDCTCGIEYLFSGGYTLVSLHGKFGAVDPNGNFIVPCIYDRFFLIDSANRHLVFCYPSDINDGAFITDMQGNLLYGPFQDINPFNEGLAAVMIGNRYGFIDTTGRIVIPCQYDEVRGGTRVIGFNNGYACVAKDGRYFFIDHDGNPLSNQEKSGFEPLCMLQDLILVHIRADYSSYGAVDKAGRVVIPLRYSGFGMLNNNSLFMQTDDKTDFYTLQGQFITSFREIQINEDLESFNTVSPFFAAQRDSLWGIVDSSLNTVIPFRYRYASYIGHGYCYLLTSDGLCHIVDMTGKTLLTAPVTGFWPVTTDLFSFFAYTPDSHSNSNYRYLQGYIDIYGNSTSDRKQARLLKEAARHRAEQYRNPVPQQTAASCETQSFEPSDDDQVFVVTEESPQFPGGDSALYMYLCTNIVYPDQARKEGIEGMVIVSFVVDTDGTITNTRILRDIGGGCGNVAVDVVRNMPPWTPGKVQGKSVRSIFNLPLLFQLSDDSGDDGMTKEERCQKQYSTWKK